MTKEKEDLLIEDKLISIQTELKAPKGQYNNFGKYSYRSAEDILEAVKPLNAKQSLLLTLTDEPILVGDWHYIKATATLTDGDDTLKVTAYARESLNKKGMDDSQITGTASSYARKYALNGMYLIDDTKDADTDEYQYNQTNNKQYNQQNDNQVGKPVILAKFKQGGGTEEQFNEWYGKQVASGFNHNQMDQYLTKALMERNK